MILVIGSTVAWSLHWMVVYQIQSIKYIGFQFNAIETNHLVKESFRLFIQNWDKTLNIFQNISNEILLFLFVSQSKEKKKKRKKIFLPCPCPHWNPGGWLTWRWMVVFVVPSMLFVSKQPASQMWENHAVYY